MSFLSSVSKAKALLVEVETKAKEVKPSFAQALLKTKEVPELVECDHCGVLKHQHNSKVELNKVECLRLVGRFQLCFTCAKAEELRLTSVKTEHVELVKESTKETVPVYAEGKEDEYLKFFNQETEEVSSLTDEQLRDRIIHWGETLFEVKIKQQKDIIVLKERAANLNKEQREKLRIDDLTYIPENPIDSPIKEIQKRRNQKERAKEDASKLGLDLDVLIAKFKIK